MICVPMAASGCGLRDAFDLKPWLNNPKPTSFQCHAKAVAADLQWAVQCLLPPELSKWAQPNHKYLVWACLGIKSGAFMMHLHAQSFSCQNGKLANPPELICFVQDQDQLPTGLPTRAVVFSMWFSQAQSHSAWQPSHVLHAEGQRDHSKISVKNLTFRSQLSCPTL